MLRRWLFGGAGALILALSSAAQAVTVGESLAGLHLKAIAGQDLQTSSLDGKITLVNFWATWCAACKVEILEMEEKLAAKLGSKDFSVAFVSLDKDPNKATEWFRANLKAPEKLMPYLYSDAQFEVADRLGVDAFPMTIIIGRDGKVAHVQKGFKEGEGSTETLVKLSDDLVRAAH